ncbi:MAG: hypothetical protein IKQ69_07890 [Oscillospiraceae bacterium]|nr:hypothetical protein [Oscillospiraceae bacterium]
MTTQNRLTKAQGIDREIETLLAVFRETEARVSAIATEIGADPHRYDEKLKDLAGQIDLRVSVLIEAQREMLAAVDSVPDGIQRTILYERYLCGHTFREIAAGLNYSVRQIQRLHKAALEALADG